MTNAYLSVLMDIVVLVFLGATIFYVLRLSSTLNAFKAQRREFDNVITNMISSIDQAERTVSSLKQTGAHEVAELKKLVHESKLLADELSIINQASESMANRLEAVAEKNRKIVQPAMRDEKSRSPMRKQEQLKPTVNKQSEKISSPVYSEQKEQNPHKDEYGSTLRKVDTLSSDKIPSFMIRDKDFDNDGDDVPDNLQSQAEKELFAALRGSKQNIGKGR
ncbi:MAG: DUF6468 domain-containing protein [Alphaproteobacteria bacterium]